MIDGGEVDEKIIAVVEHDPVMNVYNNISDLPKHMLEEMQHFFRVYKQLEGKSTYIEKVEDVEAAKNIIEESINNYNIKFKN